MVTPPMRTASPMRQAHLQASPLPVPASCKARSRARVRQELKLRLRAIAVSCTVPHLHPRPCYQLQEVRVETCAHQAHLLCPRLVHPDLPMPGVSSLVRASRELSILFLTSMRGHPVLTCRMETCATFVPP
eukprot:6801086-Alexandrium_andersonii.AAC.1